MHPEPLSDVTRPHPRHAGLRTPSLTHSAAAWTEAPALVRQGPAVSPVPLHLGVLSLVPTRQSASAERRVQPGSHAHPSPRRVHELHPHGRPRPAGSTGDPPPHGGGPPAPRDPAQPLLSCVPRQPRRGPVLQGPVWFHPMATLRPPLRLSPRPHHDHQAGVALLGVTGERPVLSISLHALWPACLLRHSRHREPAADQHVTRKSSVTLK